MSMPQIPENKHRPTLNNTVIDLLESIALEEIALSHIVNAEAEKMQAFVGKEKNFPLRPTNHEIIKFNQSVTQLLNTVLMKEWLLLKKLETVMQIEPKPERSIHEEFESSFEFEKESSSFDFVHESSSQNLNGESSLFETKKNQKKSIDPDLDDEAWI